MLFLFNPRREQLFSQLSKAFPKEYAADVKAVCNALRNAKQVYNNVFYFDHTTEWKLLSGDKITVPYRICIGDKLAFSSKLTERQELIYHCIGSRNHNGYVRQKHIEALLESDLPEWAIPYIIKICDEYVMEILEVVYRSLKDRNCDKYKEICAMNFDYIKLGHSRMISYWNEYYRYDYYRYKEYIGKKLYRECFGYSKTGQKSIQF